LDTAREKGKAVHEGWRLRKDGSKFWGTIVITALHGNSGEIIGFSKVTRDLTQKKIAEEQLLAYTTELEIQNSELEQFAYVASHDLQEPLRKIRTFADLIQENYGDEQFVKRYFHKLDESAKRMSALIRSLLNFSRLSKDESDTSAVDLNAVLAEVRQDFELLIEEKKATLTADDLPIVEGNHSQLQQLFSNLISNSLKFSKDDPRIEITCRLIEKNDIEDAPTSLLDKAYWQIDFSDNGIGFEQQYDKIIFSLFQRLHGREVYAGTGIGLALCKKITENHKGFVRASGELHKGAKFSVYLPKI
jgi:signal transduction histidine kinase